MNFYKNKRVLVTGHTGFKGSWLSIWLTILGADVCGYSLEPETSPSMFNALKLSDKISYSGIGNILDCETLERTFQQFQPEIVFHLAAQPIVRLSYGYPKLTYETNVIGTLNVLEAARKCSSTRAFVNVTTDKCYENRELNRGYKEDEPMGGYDMYSSSKACVEILSSSYRRSFLNSETAYSLATARAGNVIGGGDWAVDRLVPDCVRALNSTGLIELRNPQSVRPWQFVLEPISGYLLLGKKLYECGKKFSGSFNFGPETADVLNVSDVAQMICNTYGKGSVTVNKKDDLHEANLLMLDINKAKNILGWSPTYSAEKAVTKTVEWYRNFYENRCDMYDYTVEQIQTFREDVKWKTN